MLSLQICESRISTLDHDTSLQTIRNKVCKSVKIKYNMESKELSITDSTRKITVSIWELKEIRPGKLTMEGHWKKFTIEQCFSLFWGSEFVLKSICIVAKDAILASQWTEVLQGLSSHGRRLSYQVRQDIWIRKLFDQLQPDGLTLGIDLGLATLRLGFHDPEVIRRDFRSCSNTTGVNKSNFCQIVKGWLYSEKAFSICFGDYMDKDSDRSHGMRVTVDAFQRFICKEQKENWNGFEEYECSGIQALDDGSLSRLDVMDFLFSEKNDLWNPTSLEQKQDMTFPLSHYYISSSHNTYLTGHQLTSESSDEAYVFCLRVGCRSVELDFWDGPHRTPVITHGNTLTSSISCVQVFEAIRAHAFDTSEYPVILSIENHCSRRQQKRMVEKMKEIFGPMLVTAPLSENETTLPSPEQLKRRILLKGKRRRRNNQNGSGGNESFRQDTPEILHNAIKTGKVFFQDTCGQMKPFFMSLTSTNLKYVEIPDAQKSRTSGSERRPNAPTDIKDLHLYERWYHGKISKEEVATRLLGARTEGAFLVHDSSTFSGEFILCILSRGQPQSIRILCSSKGSRLLYHLGGRDAKENNEMSGSIFSLIYFYQDHSISIPKSNRCSGLFVQNLTSPVVVPESHEAMECFYPNMNRREAEWVLRRISETGTYLVRYAQSINWTRFVISFRCDVFIKHCRVKSQGCNLIVLARTFDNLEHLISFYSTHRFYKDMMLKYPVDSKLYNMALSTNLPANDIIVHTEDGYIYTPNTEDFLVEVRALRAYQCVPDRIDHLTFQEGAVITNVQIGEEGGMWIGDLAGQRQRYFPSDYVEIIGTERNESEMPQSGTVGLGPVQIKTTTDPRCRWVINVYETPMPFCAWVGSKKEAKSWKHAINSAFQKTSRMGGESNRMKKLKQFVTAPINHVFRSLFTPIRQKSSVIPELANLYVYAQSVPRKDPAEFGRPINRAHCQVVSYNDSSAKDSMQNYSLEFTSLHQVQMSRVYPNPWRINSMNFDPTPMWNVGAQLVALNYQTDDKWMELNCAKFLQNGGCGYVLKPDFLREPIDPNNLQLLEQPKINGLELTVKIIQGRHLTKRPESESPDLFVVVEVVGAGSDSAKVTTRPGRTRQNGFSPFWNEMFKFTIDNPQLAFIHFAVYEKTYSFGEPQLVGSQTYPVNCIRCGYRSIQLTRVYGDPSLSVLLVHVRKSTIIRET